VTRSDGAKIPSSAINSFPFFHPSLLSTTRPHPYGAKSWIFFYFQASL
jgi:hypothetical protein